MTSHQTSPQRPQVSPELLFKLRVAIARVGEMDNARWWNSEDVLGAYGRRLFIRSFAKTHGFAQARAVVEVARTRSREHFDLAGTWTLWKLPADVEGVLDERWPAWLDRAADWAPFFDQVAAIKGQADALVALHDLGLLPETAVHTFKALRRDHDGRSVALPKLEALDDAALSLLAVGFGRGEAGALAVPYVRFA